MANPKLGIDAWKSLFSSMTSTVPVSYTHRTAKPGTDNAELDTTNPGTGNDGLDTTNPETGLQVQWPFMSSGIIVLIVGIWLVLKRKAINK